MGHFTWKETELTRDCSTLESMASRFEECAKLMRKMSKAGFILKREKTSQLIAHSNEEIFKSWGFINEEAPFLQLTLISKEDEISKRAKDSQH